MYHNYLILLKRMIIMNSYGTIFRLVSWGESHSEASGCIIDGCPAGIPVLQEDITREIEMDIPDKDLGTQRIETNDVKIFSGVYNNLTIGTPICITIFNNNKKSADYEPLKHSYRPGHTEFTYHNKYGIYDHRGGGRSSGRVLISFLAASYFSKKLLSTKNISIESTIEELAGIRCNDASSKLKAKEKCMEIAKKGDSTGGIVLLKVKGLPVGVGSPLFGKLHSQIIYILSTIGGIKAIECGLGIESSKLTGSEFNDDFYFRDDKVIMKSNNAGGVLGGISTGEDLIFRLHVKPTPSIYILQNSINWETKENIQLDLNGRFDKNFTPRVGPIAEALTSFVLVDQLMLSGQLNPTKYDKDKI
jgi:chorismate synthase